MNYTYKTYLSFVGRLGILCCMLWLVSCGSSKSTTRSSQKRPARSSVEQVSSATSTGKKTIGFKAANEALKFKGTRYKYGGSTKKGMDCSGLICTAYGRAGKKVARTTTALITSSREVELDDIRVGDLLFFGTGKNRRRMNHVGMVTNVTAAEITFIHSTTSRGVITSSLDEPYWLKAYLSAGRL